VARPVNLAQASQSRLGEMKQGGPARDLAQATRSPFEQAGSSPRRGGISLKRDPVMPTHLSLCSRLGEGEARLSETPQPGRDAGRGCVMFWTFDDSRMICFDWV